MVTRINLIMQEKRLSQSQFASAINIQRSTLSHILSGRNNPSLDFVIKVVEAFPDISLEWLARGIGNMHSDENKQIENNEKNESSTQKQAKASKKVKEYNYSLFPDIINNNDSPLENESEVIHKDQIKPQVQKAINSTLENNSDPQKHQYTKENATDINKTKSNTHSDNPQVLAVNNNNEINSLSKKTKADSIIILYNDGTYQMMQ